MLQTSTPISLCYIRPIPRHSSTEHVTETTKASFTTAMEQLTLTVIVDNFAAGQVCFKYGKLLYKH